MKGARKILEAMSYDSRILELEAEWDSLDGNPARRSRQIEVESELAKLRKIKARFQKAHAAVDRTNGPGVVTSRGRAASLSGSA